jgi:hypothetical protein
MYTQINEDYEVKYIFIEMEQKFVAKVTIREVEGKKYGEKIGMGNRARVLEGLAEVVPNRDRGIVVIVCLCVGKLSTGCHAIPPQNPTGARSRDGGMVGSCVGCITQKGRRTVPASVVSIARCLTFTSTMPNKG